MTRSTVKRCFIFCSALLFCAIADIASASESLLQDSAFAQGYEVMSPLRDIYTDHSRTEVIQQFQATGKKPFWRLVQWGSHKTLAKALPELLSDGSKRWAVTEMINHQMVLYKSVTLNPAGTVADSSDHAAVITLELNAEAEFNHSYLSSSDEYWPHLLLVQNPKTVKLGKYQTLTLSLDARLLFDERNIGNAYNSHLHAARFLISFLVRNTLSGDSFWLNIPVYDDRFRQSSFGCQKCLSSDNCYVPQSLHDAGKWLCPFDGERWSKASEKQGTHRMLFRVPSAAITSDHIEDGQWVHYTVDLIPYIKAGIQAARDQGKSPGFSASLLFYNLNLFTMGWEITGLNHAAMEVKNLSLRGA